MVLQIKLAVVVVGVTNKLYFFVCLCILISKLRDKGVNEKLLTSIETKYTEGSIKEVLSSLSASATSLIAFTAWFNTWSTAVLFLIDNPYPKLK